MTTCATSRPGLCGRIALPSSGCRGRALASDENSRHPTRQRMSGQINAGLLVMHGNRLELLGEAVFGWLARHPLGPLEQEIFLVQSNGVAEWLKMELASAHGICAATSGVR